MQNTAATKTFVTDSHFSYSEQNGMRFERHYTKDGVSPYDQFEYELRGSMIRETSGRVIFEMQDVEVPKSWSQVATDILAQKYFRKAGVPQYNEDGTPKLDKDGKPVLGSEKSIKQVAHRLAGTWRYWAEKQSYFASEQDAQVFYDELVFMIISQRVAPNSPQWFNTGLNWAYGINGPAQGHYYTDHDTGVTQKSEDSYTHPQPHACGRYDTKIFTDKGIMNMGEIVDDNLNGIKVFDGDKFVQVQAVKNNGVKKVFRATLKNGNYIEFTDDHQIWSANEREKDGGKYDWVELEELLNKKVQQFSLNKCADVVNNDSQGEDKASLAGFIIGDGYYGKYNKNKKTTLFGAITINDDEYNEVTRLFTSIFGKYTEQLKPDIHDKYRIIKNDSKDVDEFVQEFELDQSSYTVKVPEKVFKGTKKEKQLFVRSLFQADGCVRERSSDGRNSGDVVLTSISEELVHGVQILLLELGIYSNISLNVDRRDNRKNSYQLTIAYASERKKYEEEIGFISTEKIDKLKHLNESIEGKQKSNRSEQTVISIEEVAEEEVYDIQTESGKFCANGVVVHNCFIQSVRDDLVNEGGIMDLWVREARLFKYGSGTGSNFSNLRGEGEQLSSGGVSSGLMSWLKIGDRAAGAIKSGGTTRRAAKMVIVDVDHPDVETFVEWKVKEERKVAALMAAGYDSSYEGEAYQTVSGQNSNNTVRVTHEYMESVESDSDWDLINRTDGNVNRTIKARDLWEKVAKAAWSCADPGIQFDTTVNDWHTCPKSGRINASNPCSEYMFLDDTACNLASINLGHYYDTEEGKFEIESFKHTVRLWTTVLEIAVMMAQYPSREIALRSYEFRTLGLGYANIGSVLMTAGFPYDSTEAMAFTACVTGIMTAESYATSAELARTLGPFKEYENNKADMLRVIRNHRRAAYNMDESEYENIAITPQGIDADKAPEYLLKATRDSWDTALQQGEKHGYRNAQVTVLAPTGTIGLIMDCATTGVEPDFALVKFKKLAGGGYFKIVNSSVSSALRVLKYSEQEIDDIIKYLKGSGNLKDSPHVNDESLKEKGLLSDEIEKIEKSLPTVFELSFAFNAWTLGEECLSRLGFSKKQYEDPNFDLLRALGYTDEQLLVANEHVCGAMTIEGAPHLKDEHYAVFDTANKNGNKGKRYIHYLGHIKMLAAVQPFVSGSISKTVNMPHEVTIEDVKTAYMASWKLGLKANALYRDGCKLSQPLSARSSDKNEDDQGEDKDSSEEVEAIVKEEAVTTTETVSETKYVLSNEEEMVEQLVQADQVVIKYGHDGSSKGKKVYLHGEQRKMPYKRSGITVKAKMAGQSVFIRTGEYPDGRLGEVFIDMYREGAAFRSMLNLFAVSISNGLQYGVPLEEYVEKFTFTRFEPSGMTDHPNIRSCTSIIDFVFRLLGMEYLGRTDFVQVKPTGIQKNKAEQLAKMAAAASGQKSLGLDDVEDEEVEEDSQMTLPNIEKEGRMLDPVEAHLTNIQSDAPPCGTCGHTTVRNGTCYKCLNCGSTTGCS